MYTKSLTHLLFSQKKSFVPPILFAAIHKTQREAAFYTHCLLLVSIQKVSLAYGEKGFTILPKVHARGSKGHL